MLLPARPSHPSCKRASIQASRRTVTAPPGNRIPTRLPQSLSQHCRPAHAFNSNLFHRCLTKLLLSFLKISLYMLDPFSPNIFSNSCNIQLNIRFAFLNENNYRLVSRLPIAQAGPLRRPNVAETFVNDSFPRKRQCPFRELHLQKAKTHFIFLHLSPSSLQGCNLAAVTAASVWWVFSNGSTAMLPLYHQSQHRGAEPPPRLPGPPLRPHSLQLILKCTPFHDHCPVN